MARILLVVAIILLVLWLAGLVFRVLGNLIHILLVVALVVILWSVITRRG